MLYFKTQIINNHMNYNYIPKEKPEKYRIDGLDELIVSLHEQQEEARIYYAFSLKKITALNNEASVLNDII